MPKHTVPAAGGAMPVRGRHIPSDPVAELGAEMAVVQKAMAVADELINSSQEHSKEGVDAKLLHEALYNRLYALVDKRYVSACAIFRRRNGAGRAHQPLHERNAALPGIQRDHSRGSRSALPLRDQVYHRRPREGGWRRPERFECRFLGRLESTAARPLRRCASGCAKRRSLKAGGPPPEASRPTGGEQRRAPRGPSEMAALFQGETKSGRCCPRCCPES
jgi:hypothetical protein